MIPPVDPAEVERVAELLDYHGSTGGVADRDVAAMLRALSSALTQAQEELDALKSAKRALLCGHPQPRADCHWCRAVAPAFAELFAQLATAHQHLGTALANRACDKWCDDDDGYCVTCLWGEAEHQELAAIRAYYEAHK